MERQSYRVELTRSDYAAGLAAVMAELARLDTARKPMLFARLGMTIAILLVIAYAFPLSAAALFAAILMFWIGDMVIQRLFATQLLGISYDPAVHASTEVEFSEEGIVERAATRTRQWSWDALRRLHHPSGLTVLETVGWDMIILPHKLWPSPDARNAFVNDVRAQLPDVAHNDRTATPKQAVTQLKLTEPVLLARIALSVAVFQLIFESFIPPAPPQASGPLLALVAAALGGTITWWGSGRAFGWLAERSAKQALAAAWGIFALFAIAFALWFFQLI